MVTFSCMLVQDLLWSEGRPGYHRKSGFKAMVSLFNGTQSEDQESLQYCFLCKKVSTTKTFVKPERLPSATSATNRYCRQTYLLVMQWMGKNDGMDCAE